MNKIKKLVQSILSIKIINNFINYFSFLILSFGKNNYLTAYIYSLLFPHTFLRESMTVIRGKYQNQKNKLLKTNVSPDLRRNIHRLEKGISITNRKEVFALNYIEETITFFLINIKRLNQEESIDIRELIWARDVIENYFQVVKKDKFLQNLESKFKKNLSNLKIDEYDHKFIPFNRSTSPPVDIGIESFHQLILLRRSVRFFLNKTVERNKIEKAISLARYAPSACNRSPYRYAIFDEPETVKKIASIPFGTSGYSNGIPVIIAIVGDFSNYFSSRDKHVPYVDASLSVMTFMYTCEILGLSTCAINWPDFEPLEIKCRKHIKLERYERVIMFIACGYASPNGYIPFSAKKSVKSIISYNE